MATIFDDKFTNLYALSKTLRFELKPVGKTLENMKNKEILIRDEDRAEAYKQIKPLFDDLHAKFISESLSKAKIDWNNYFELYKKFRNEQDKDKKRKMNEKKGELFVESEKLRKEIIKLFEITANEWKSVYKNDKNKPLLKEKGYKILTEAGIMEVLKHKYKEDKDKLDIINKFKGFFTYFTGFNQNRENYYSSDDKDTAVSNRIVNENLPKFCQNVITYQEKLKDINLIDQKEIFNVNYFNECLTQEDTDIYNQIIGGYRDEKDIKGEKIQGINEKINLYNQSNKDLTKLPKLKTLFKQIGGLTEKKELFFEIDDDNHTLIDTLNLYIKKSKTYNEKIENLFKSLSQRPLNQIYISKNAINTISGKYFSNWHLLQEKLIEIKTFKSEKERIKIPDFISLNDLKDGLDAIQDDPKNLFKKDYQKIFAKGNFTTFLNILNYELDENEKEWDKNKSKLEEIINILKNNNKDHKNIIKNFADSALAIYQMTKYFKVREGKVSGTNTEFYNELNTILNEYPCFKWYEAIRNYLTKKPYSQDKIKINFDKGNLLGGWPDSPEGNTQYCGFIFRNKGKYYLGISNNTRLFDNLKFPEAYKSDGNFEKMIYKQLDGKTIYGKIYFGKFGSKYANDKEKLEPQILIKRIKSILSEKVNYFPQLNSIINKPYKDANKLATDISEETLYNIKFTPVSEKYINESLVSSDKKLLYLFGIYNKDFSENKKSSSKTNLHTDYFLKLFIPFNEETLIKLSGGGQIFFRSKTEKLNVRLDKENKEKIFNNIRKNNIKEKVLQNRRYAEDKLFFHLPIVLNATKSNKVKDFNKNLNQRLLSIPKNIHIIGIDRGEKHLAYYSVINMSGEIVEQGTLNKDLLGKDYAEKLDSIAGKREDARKNWDEIGTIKELKNGYISQVVRRIADLIIKYNAVVVFEDLNIGFKRGRQKIEKSVYQKLELALAKKLNFLVQKKARENEIGSVTKALQLTPPVNTFSDIKGKQFGVILYTRAAYTSVTDPLTGFRKNIYLKPSKKENMRNMILKFKEIGYDSNKKAFYFKYNPKDFYFKSDKIISKEWTVWSCVERIRNEKKEDKKKWEAVPYNVTELLQELFKKKGISLNDKIIEQIKDKTDFDNKFYENLIFYINLILQLRNSDSSKNLDFIQSPVDPFFESRIYENKYPLDETGITKSKMPINGDANGAFNIARKGILMLKKILAKPDKPDLYIDDLQWDSATQNWKNLAE